MNGAGSTRRSTNGEFEVGQRLRQRVGLHSRGRGAEAIIRVTRVTPTSIQVTVEHGRTHSAKRGAGGGRWTIPLEWARRTLVVA